MRLEAESHRWKSVSHAGRRGRLGRAAGGDFHIPPCSHHKPAGCGSEKQARGKWALWHPPFSPTSKRLRQVFRTLFSAFQGLEDSARGF
jgi:hypothetical protein